MEELSCKGLQKPRVYFICENLLDRNKEATTVFMKLRLRAYLPSPSQVVYLPRNQPARATSSRTVELFETLPLYEPFKDKAEKLTWLTVVFIQSTILPEIYLFFSRQP